ncbi:hypothetical protein [Absidia glauca]|uniref:Uncharacterized protein n=1 Tax=Absidia glauca TaxID=4829 RepID=A0A163KI78_ABSGL|nr:hypothetical protein [Absidia glauca]
MQFLNSDAGLTLSIQSLYDPGGNKNQTNTRLQEDQSAYTMSPLQDGGGTSFARGDTGGRLDLQIGPEGRICGGPDPPRLPTISLVPSPRLDISIPITSIWYECGSEGFLQTNEIRYGSLTGTRNPVGILPGRHLSLVTNTIRNGQDNINSIPTSGELGVYHQLQEERPGTEAHSGVSRVLIQKLNNGNQGPCQEDDQVDPTNQAGVRNQVLSVDCRSVRKYHQYDTGHRRCPPQHQVHSTGSGTQSPLKSPPLGPTLPLVDTGSLGIELVGIHGNDQEWVEDPTTSITSTNRRNFRGCLRLGLGDQVLDHTDSGPLDIGRKRTIDQCTGTQDDPFCAPTSCKRLCTPTRGDTLRQHHSIEVCSVLYLRHPIKAMKQG